MTTNRGPYVVVGASGLLGLGRSLQYRIDWYATEALTVVANQSMHAPRINKNYAHRRDLLEFIGRETAVQAWWEPRGQK